MKRILKRNVHYENEVILKKDELFHNGIRTADNVYLLLDEELMAKSDYFFTEQELRKIKLDRLNNTDNEE